MSSSRSCKSFPEPADAPAWYGFLGRQDGGVPRLDAVNEETVRETALVAALGGFFDAEGAEFGIALVDVPVGSPD